MRPNDRPPLAGLRVLELAEGIAGPSAAAYLADLGADVVKVETAEGDTLRGGRGFAAYNRGKRSVVLGLDADGTRALSRAVQCADAAVIGEEWGDRLRVAGVAIEDLCERADTVLCTIPPLGSGAASTPPSDEDVVAAVTGLMWAQAGHEPGPVRSALPLLSSFVGMLAAAGTVAALLQRLRGGRAPRVEVPWVTVSAMLVGLVGTRSDQIERGSQAPNPLGQQPAYRVYETSDGWICVACPNPDFYSRFCLALELPEFVTDERFANAPWGVPDEHQQAQREAFSAALGRRPLAEWLERFHEFDVPAAPVQELRRYLEGEIVEQNRLLIPAGAQSVARFPAAIGDWQQTQSEPAPELGSAGSLADLDWPLRSAPMGRADPRPALAGVRVLDLTTYLAGPVCGTLLGDLGADVVKVEPVEGEGFRSGGLSCLGINRGKRALAVDLSVADGRRPFGELLRRADVLLLGFRAGVAERLGLDADALASSNPRLVRCEFSGYGEAAAYQRRPSFDPLIQALSGQMALQGSRDGRPVFLGTPVNDFAAGFLGLMATLAALYRREQGTPSPTTVKVTQAGAALELLAAEIGTSDGAQEAFDPLGRDAFHRLYEAAGGVWVYVHIDDDARDAWLRSLRLSTEIVDASTRGRTALSIAERIRARSADHLVGGSGDGAVVVIVESPFTSRPDAPIFRDSGSTARYSHPMFGNLVAAGRVMRVGTGGDALRAGPWVGEHTREILAQAGVAEEEIDRLYATGIVATREVQFATQQ